MTYVKKFSWASYSHKLKMKILNQRSCGVIEKSKEDSGKNTRLVIFEEGSVSEGSHVKFFLLVDEGNGEILDAKYTLFGESALVGALEIICELVLKKNYDQAKRISSDLIDKHVRSSSKKAAFPPEVYSHINFALGILDGAIEKCKDIPLADGYELTPVDLSDLEDGEYPDWENLNEDERILTIRSVIESDILPYVELDDGGVKITELKGDHNVVIQYSGSCTSCYAATGSTLSAIQQILRKRVHPKITVTPDL